MPENDNLHQSPWNGGEYQESGLKIKLYSSINLPGSQSTTVHHAASRTHRRPTTSDQRPRSS